MGRGSEGGRGGPVLRGRGVAEAAAASAAFAQGLTQAASLIDGGAHESAVDAFLNVERMVASKLQVDGYDAVAKRFGAERAKAALKSIQGTNAALRAAARGLEETVVWRGQLAPEKMKGKALSNRNIWSATPDKMNAARFAIKGGKNAVLYKIHTKSAVPTDGLRSSNTHREALIPSQTKFQRVRTETTRVNGKRLKVIVLRET